MARRAQGNDRAQAKGIFEGQCDVAIMNHYYYGKMLHGDKEDHRAWANSIRLGGSNWPMRDGPLYRHAASCRNNNGS